MRIFDSHCHLDDKTYRKDISRVIERAHENSVMRMMTVGVDKNTAERAVELAEVRGEDPDQLAQTVWENTNRLYRIN